MSELLSKILHKLLSDTVRNPPPSASSEKSVPRTLLTMAGETLFKFLPTSGVHPNLKFFQGFQINRERPTSGVLLYIPFDALFQVHPPSIQEEIYILTFILF